MNKEEQIPEAIEPDGLNSELFPDRNGKMVPFAELLNPDAQTPDELLDDCVKEALKNALVFHGDKALDYSAYLMKFAEDHCAGMAEAVGRMAADYITQLRAGMSQNTVVGTERSGVHVAQMIAGQSTEQVNPMNIFKPIEAFSELEMDWLIEKWLPKGQIALLAADGGVGKTTMACEIMAAISSGGTCILDPPGFQREPGKVLMLTVEDSITYVLRKKLRLAGAALENIWAVDVAADKDGLAQNLKLGTDFMKEVIRTYNPDLCYIDPIQGFIPENTHMGARNEMRACMEPIRALGEELGVTFLVVCHSNKKPRASGRDRVSDSSDLWDIARSVWMMGWTEEENERYLSNEKNSYAAQQKTVLFAINDHAQVEFRGYSEKKDRDYVADFWKGRERARQEAEPVNQALIDAIKAEANPFEPVKITYSAFREKYGDLIFGGKQPAKAFDLVDDLLRNAGYIVAVNKKFNFNKSDGKRTSAKGFVITEIAEPEQVPLSTDEPEDMTRPP